MFIISPTPNVHMPKSNGLLVSPSYRKHQEKIARQSYCYTTFYKRITITNVAYFLKSYCRTLLRTVNLSGVKNPSHLTTSHVLQVLLIVENSRVRSSVASSSSDSVCRLLSRWFLARIILRN
jgi:hypothetical protein